MDTGYSNHHVIESKSSFADLNENFRWALSSSAISIVNVMEKGDIHFRAKCKTYIECVLVPVLKCNLLSVNQLVEKEFITLRNDTCEIYDPSRRVIAIKMFRTALWWKVKNPSWLFSMWSLELWWLEDPSTEDGAS